MTPGSARSRAQSAVRALSSALLVLAGLLLRAGVVDAGDVSPRPGAIAPLHDGRARVTADPLVPRPVGHPHLINLSPAGSEKTGDSATSQSRAVVADVSTPMTATTVRANAVHLRSTVARRMGTTTVPVSTAPPSRPFVRPSPQKLGLVAPRESADG